MTFVIKDPSEDSKVRFETLKIGQVFKDLSGDYSLKIDQIEEFNSVLLVPATHIAAGTLWITENDEVVTPVLFNVTVTPV